MAFSPTRPDRATVDGSPYPHPGNYVMFEESRNNPRVGIETFAWAHVIGTSGAHVNMHHERMVEYRYHGRMLKVYMYRGRILIHIGRMLMYGTSDGYLSV